MYTRILLALALALALLIFAGEQRVLHAQSMTISPGPGGPTGPGFQAPQQQQEHPCQAEFTKLRDDIQSKGKALQEAGKRKATPKELCARINSYSAAEVNMLNFFTKKSSACGIPPDAAEGLKKNRVKTVELRTKICSAAANPGPGPQSPSAGLSGAINQGTSAVPETPSGGGIFDTLSGNILQQ